MRCAGSSVRPDNFYSFDLIYWELIFPEWPQASDIHMNESFRNQLSELVQGEEAKSLLLQFEDAQISELAKALEAPVCEFVSSSVPCF